MFRRNGNVNISARPQNVFIEIDIGAPEFSQSHYFGLKINIAVSWHQLVTETIRHHYCIKSDF